MSFNLEQEHKSRFISGNSVIELNDPDQTWLVKTGHLAVFILELDRPRRYLFSVAQGSILFGLNSDRFQLIAVSIQESCLIAMNLATTLTKDNLTYWHSSLESSLGKSLTVSQNQPLLDQLTALHQDFINHLADIIEKENSLALEQFYQKQQLEYQGTQDALIDLAALVKPQSITPEADDLLTAMMMVGSVLGIKIYPANSNRVEDIAHASRIRIRRVQLLGKWWKKEAGPLLGFVNNEQPVALLPIKGKGYQLINPHTKQRIIINNQIAKTLTTFGYTFYRSFPDKDLTSFDLVNFALFGKQKELIWLTFIAIIVSLLGMITPQATYILIDHAIPDGDRFLLWQLAGGLIATSFGVAIFQLTQGLSIIRFQSIADLTTQAGLWDKLLKLKMSFFRQYSTGDLQARVSAIDDIRNMLSGTLMSTFLGSLFSLFNLGLLFFYSANLAWTALALSLLGAVVTLIAGIRSLKILREEQELQGKIFGLVIELIGGITKLRVAFAQNRAFAYWIKKYTYQLRLNLSNQLTEDLLRTFNKSLPIISSILLFGVSVSLMSQGESKLSTGTFLAFNVAFGIFIESIMSLSNTLIDVLVIPILWERAQPILTAKPEVDFTKTSPGKLTGQIRLQGVSFGYYPNRPILQNINIEAKAGEFIAIVGPSGSGKSTLVRLLLGFENPETGKILYDGQDLTGLDLWEVRRQMGVVMQNAKINNGSIFDNIAGSSLITVSDAIEAIQQVGLANTIDQMPMGIHTVISQGGSNLSGGQQQQLLIARALVHKPKILIFDEATSALDNQTQQIVSESLEKLSVTRIAIAHRLSTIKNAHRIYVLDRSLIVQQGTFDELINQSGLFAELMKRQTV